MNRRNFIRSMAAFGAATGLPGCATLPAAGGPELKVGVLSDIHISGPETATYFERALLYFREKGADAVVIAGDITNCGLVPELQNVADAWYKVFPDDKLPDGRHVEKVFLYGNHDHHGYMWKSATTGERWKGADYERVFNMSIAKDPAAAWRKCFREDFAQVYAKTVKGYTFIAAHWDKPEGIPAVKDFMAKTGPSLDGSKPFFFCQHQHPKDTCLPFAPHDSGIATRALEPFPNAIALSGHAHQPLTDERNIWQGAFTSIGTASLKNVGGRNWRENGAPYAAGMSKAAHMPDVRGEDCRQGLFMRIYRDRVEIERRDFFYGLPVGADWRIPWPLSRGRPFAFEARAAVTGKAEFAPGTEVKLEVGDGETDAGEPMGRLVVSFPAAAGKGRVYDYEVEALLEEEDLVRPVASKRVMAPDYYLPDAKKGLPGEAWFALCELPEKARLRFAVYPLNCFGAKGAPIFTSALWKRPMRSGQPRGS